MTAGPALPPPSSAGAPPLRQLLVTLVGGVALVGAGVALLLLGDHTVGAVLAGAGAAELGAKGTATLLG